MKKRILYWLRDNGIYLVARLYCLYFRLIRVEYINKDYFMSWMEKGPLICAHLHGDDLALLSPLSDQGLTVMVSLSKDGEALARAMQIIGFNTVRGSSSNRGREAFRDMEKLVLSGKPVVFTVDGPSGPRGKVKPGVILLAKRTQAPIFLAVVEPGAGILFRKTWHQTYLPYPFSKVRYRAVGPFYISANASSEEFQALIEELEQILATSGMAGRAKS